MKKIILFTSMLFLLFPTPVFAMNFFNLFNCCRKSEKKELAKKQIYTLDQLPNNYLELLKGEVIEDFDRDELLAKILKAQESAGYPSDNNKGLLFGCSLSADGMVELMGQRGIIELLLKYGACINYQDERGETPLLVALTPYIRGTGYQHVPVLLQKGADVNLADRVGRTPLMAACLFGDERIITSLLDNGADLVSKDNRGNSILVYAQKHEGLISFLHKYVQQKKCFFDSVTKKARRALLLCLYRLKRTKRIHPSVVAIFKNIFKKEHDQIKAATIQLFEESKE